jgi:glycosyltransferase involved in cell wall biosynthesis
MNISVVISAYNRPEYLELVLWGYATQSDRDFELIVADDGSGDDVRSTISRLRSDAGLEITHVWHEDLGFRKSLILNRAIVSAAGDYLLFTDGDCIPRRDLVEVHRRLARPNRYLAGGYVKLPKPVSEGITVDEVRAGRIADLRWLRSRGWRPGRRALRLLRYPGLPALLDKITPTAAHFHGNNASTWKEALFEVNGFDAEMGYGGLDRALGYRLVNAGVKGIQIRHRAVTMHLHHDRPYRRPEVLEANRRIMDRIRRLHEVRARSGIGEMGPEYRMR